MILFDNNYFIAGVDDIIPVIVIIGVLIAKFIEFTSGKTKKKPTVNDKPYTASQDELKNFLETLTGTVNSESETVAAPPPPPQFSSTPVNTISQPHIHHAHTGKAKAKSWKRIKHDREKEHPEVPYAPTTHKTPQKKHYGTPVNKPHIVNMQKKDFNWDDTKVKYKEKLVTPEMIGNGLVSRKSLAQAFVMKEILDTPLGLRTE